jgi:hypothetical protein
METIQETLNKQRVSTNNTPKKEKTKWTTFTYHGPDTKPIRKLFKNTNIRTSFKTTNTTRNHLDPREETTDTYNQSGLHQYATNVHSNTWGKQEANLRPDIKNISKL